MSHFSIIENPTLASSPPPPAARTVETGNTRALTQGRQFHVLNNGAEELLPLINPRTGGAFLAADRVQDKLGRYRSMNSSVPLVIEPRAIRHSTANHLHQFFDDEGAGLSLSGLNAVLDQARAWNADCALTPTGQIQVGDLLTLQRTIDLANKLSRDDVLLAIPLASNWLSNADLHDSLIAALNESRHQVALTFFDANADSIGSGLRMRAYRKLIATTTADIVAYRVGLQGLDAVAHGAIASAIGSYPALRGLAKAGSGDGRLHPPHLLLGDLLEYVPTQKMRDDWFRTKESLTCACAVCGGEKIDRFYALPAHRRTAHQHNTLELDRLFASLTSLGIEGVPVQWGHLVHDAKSAYARLQSYTGRPEKTPPHLQVWGQPVNA